MHYGGTDKTAPMIPLNPRGSELGEESVMKRGGGAKGVTSIRES